jgi:mono/diheme cytochrome c family protein
MRAGRMMTLLLVVAAVGGAAIWVVAKPRPALSSDTDPSIGQEGNAERGRLIFAAGDCASCHASPGQPDRLRLGGGLALASSYGTFRPPNISSDPIDGIGAWRTIDLANALLSGVSPAGAHYYPAFPYTSYAKMKIADIKDLMAYLRTLPAVSGRPPPHDLSVIFRVRRIVGLWKILFFDRTPIVAEPGRDETWNRGRYLAEAVAHCAECHSSRNLMGAIKPDTRFAGGTDPEGTGYIPNITPSRIGDWNERDIAEMFKTGNTPNHGRVGSSMAAVVTNLAMLPQSDRDAIAAFVKSLPSRETPRP